MFAKVLDQVKHDRLKNAGKQITFFLFLAETNWKMVVYLLTVETLFDECSKGCLRKRNQLKCGNAILLFETKVEHLLECSKGF